jgi:hypothetical protein
MSIDRYLHLVHGAWYRSYRKPKYAQIICLLIWTGKQAILLFLYIPIRLICFQWVVSLVFMFPYAYFFNINGNNHNQSYNTSNCIVNDKNSLLSSCIFTFGFYYVLPLSIIFLCYLRVFLRVRRTGYEVVKRLVSSL